MDTLRKLFCVAALSSVGTGCATLTFGTEQDFVINSDPEGANVVLSTGQICVTPCTLKLKRKHSFDVKLKSECHKTAWASVVSEWAGTGIAGMTGNVLIGGLVGIGVDSFSGATKHLVPNPLEVTMEPDPECEVTSETGETLTSEEVTLSP